MKKVRKYGISALLAMLFALCALCGCSELFGPYPNGGNGNSSSSGNGGNGGNGGGQSEQPAPKSEFASGSGTEADPYIIAEPYQWTNINKHLSSYFELSADLNMGDIGDLASVGSPTAPFTGNLDGKGHTVHSAKLTSGGFFGTVSGGTVKNVYLQDSSIKVTENGAGGFVGAVKMGGVVENCHIKDVTFARLYSGDYCGGFVGTVASASYVKYCSAENVAFSWGAQSQRLGFLMGRIEGGTVEACWVTGTAKLGYGDISGIVCRITGGTTSDCFAQVNASGEAQTISTIGWIREGGKVERVLSFCDFLECELRYASQIGTPFSSSKVPIESTVKYFGPSKIEDANSIIDGEWKLWKKGKLHPELVSYKEYLTLSAENV